MFNASPKLLKHIVMVGTFVASTWMGAALAQTANPSPDSGPTGRENGTMENYLTNHPKVADELHNNPSLINDPQWLSQHPTVQNWMNTHQNVKQDAIRNPQEFVHHTENETVHRDRQAMNRTDSYLTKHPEMAKELNKNPGLINDPKYLADHPSLNNYLKEHPGAAKEWQDHPQAYADAARADERYNRTGQAPHVHQTKPVARK